MNPRYLYKSNIINVLIGTLIGLFIIFPDMIIIYDLKHPYFPENGIRIPHYENAPDPSRPYYRPEPPPENILKPPSFEITGHKIYHIFYQFLFFFLLSFGLLYLNKPTQNKKSGDIIPWKLRTVLTIALTLLLSFLGIYIFSKFQLFIFPHIPLPWYKDGILLFKGLFVFLFVVLFSQLLNLVYKQQTIVLENETLKSESLLNKIKALSSQISPHFFFNSLNSLSGLIREKNNPKALKYINELSLLFRYVLKSKEEELVMLKDEMLFLAAYQYLLNIQYEDKLTFQTEVDDHLREKKMLPALSIQPMVENIIKHNIISHEIPMLIRVYIEGENLLVIENNYQPKKENIPSTGIGLSNLRKRYKYLTGKEINNYIIQNKFVVELPLIER
jgi:two-component system, LytTR family, sensor kinase